MPQPVFSHVQLYIAFSRVKSQKNVKVLFNDTPIQGRLTLLKDKFFTSNIVYREILNNNKAQKEIKIDLLSNDELNSILYSNANVEHDIQLENMFNEDSDLNVYN